MELLPLSGTLITGWLKPVSRQRTAIPNRWLDPQVPPAPTSPNLSAFDGLGPLPLTGLQQRPDAFGSEDEEPNPTAIVIKNNPLRKRRSS
ncbi:hypothetical protein MMC15_003742 [Xylographa vitiligo]|nr:hypothetical protein [Xylographa vitiligo]